MTIQIEKGVALPAKKSTRGSKYPFGQMEAGDSFYVEGVKPSTMSNTASRFAKANEGFKFSVRGEGEGVRVWRVEA